MKRRGRPVLVLVLLLVNGAAIWGQAGWGLEHIVPASWTPMGGPAIALALGFAAAIELTGVFLSISADDAEDRGLPSGGIRLGSYGVGILSGLLNYSHWTGAAAIAFGLLSTVSPFLWGINSRVNRARPIAPSRRFWHPVRSVSLIRFMAWRGIPLEQDGIDAMKAETAERAARNREVAKSFMPTLIDPEFVTPIEPITEIGQQAADALGITLNPRLPRAPKADQEKAVRMMLDADGDGSEAVAAGLMGASTMRRYVAARRELAAGRPAPTDKVNAELIEIIRKAVAAA